jgi:hypothetical protein
MQFEQHLRRVVPLRLLVCAGVVLCWACTKPNPEACCTSEVDCAVFGLPDVTLCGDGLKCENHTCTTADCSVDMDCSASHPVCVLGVCVDCDATHACPDSEPVCDVSANRCEGCTSNADCEARTEAPVCEQGGCVQCATAAECGAATPVCDANTCRACRLDSECDSGACNVDGSCVPEDQILYISPTGLGSNPCTQAEPCGNLLDIQLKVTPTRFHIVMATGTYPNRTSLGAGNINAPELVIHGHGSTFTHATTSGAATLDIALPMTIRDVTFLGDSPGVAVFAHASLIVLESVTFSDAKGLSVTAGALVARDFRSIGTRDLAAITLSNNADVTIDRGEISGGDVAISGASGTRVHLTNLLVHGTFHRALELSGVVGELDSSTIADSGSLTAAAPCTLACDANLHVTSSIIRQLTCAGATLNAAGPCTFASSIVSNGPTPGAVNVDPQFVDPAGFDYHVKPGSPAIDAVDTGPGLDFEGDVRPQGAKFDIGADEAR